MKFEYKLDYDFVSGEMHFEIKKMPEKFRNTFKVTQILSANDNVWSIESLILPDIVPEKIFLRGSDTGSDDSIVTRIVDPEYAIEVADVLKKFQKWVEDNCSETCMTIAEIEAKLGIKNLKIIKEGK